MLRNYARFALVAGLLAVSQPALANDLENSCVDSPIQRDDAYLCVTALEFGGQVANLRELLLMRHFGAAPDDNGLTRSTSGTDNPTSGMFSLGAQATGGSFSGNMQTLTFGADRGLADGSTFFGALVQFGNSQVTAPGSPRVTRREILIGPYFGADLGAGLFLDGSLLVGKPDYTVANVPSEGKTILGYVTLAKAFETEKMSYVLFSSLAAKREKPTAVDRIDATVLTLGGRLRFEDTRISTGWRQNYARVEVDIGNYSDNLSAGSINYVTPRLAIGTDIAFDNGGSLNLSANASAASDKTYIMGLQASYLLQF